MKRFPLINSESDIEAHSMCPNSVYISSPTCSGDFLTVDALKSAIIGKFCNIDSNDDTTSGEEKWRLRNIELKQCHHAFPR